MRISAQNSENAFTFQAKVWKYNGPAGWYFVTLPPGLVKKIQLTKSINKSAWGFIKVTAVCEKEIWNTSIYPDRRHGYLLAIKSEIRRKVGITEQDTIKIKIILPEKI